MNISPTWFLLLVCAHAALARAWTWPQEPTRAASVRIDTKVRFVDDDSPGDKVKRGNVQSDETFRQPSTTDGFYNRPPGEGRYPVKVVKDPVETYRVNSEAVYRVETKNDGTETVTFCKCVSNPECNPRRDSLEICGVGKYLCCYKRPNKNQLTNSDIFNEIEDERPTLLPGREKPNGPFPPPPNTAQPFHPTHNEYLHFGAINVQRKPVLVGPEGPTGNIGPTQQAVLVGPGGPTGVVDPTHLYDKRGILVGPSGPSGVIGPREPAASAHEYQNAGQNSERGVLVGPEGPTGVIGPTTTTHQNLETSAAAQRGVLVGPGGPTGVIGPYGNRGVLTGPRGPTGIIGPNPNRNRGVLVGPGGPTGIIGPGYGRQSGPGLLVGPGGPTGSIGPGRGLLTGPGGPTGRIGPQPYYGNYGAQRKRSRPPCTRAPILSYPKALTPATTKASPPPSSPPANCSSVCAVAAPAAAPTPLNHSSYLHTNEKATGSKCASKPHADPHAKAAAASVPTAAARTTACRPQRQRQHAAWASKSTPDTDRNLNTSPQPPPDRNSQTTSSASKQPCAPVKKAKK